MKQFFQKNIIVTIFVFISLVGLAYYLQPLFRPDKVMGSLPGDPYYYIYETKWFCDNYYNQYFINKDLYAPNGVDMSLGYHMPALLTVGCLFQSKGPVAMFNIIIMFQVFLIFASSVLVAIRFFKNNYIRIFFIFIYSFSTFYLTRSSGHIDVLSTVWGISLCFYFFYDLNLTERKRVILAFLALTFSITSCWQNIPNLFVLTIVLLYKNVLEYKDKWKLIIKNLFIASFVSLPIFLVLSYPLFFSFLGKKMVKDYSSSFIYNADALSYLVPSKGSIVYNLTYSLSQKISHSRHSSFFEQSNSIDYIVLGIFMFSLFIKERRGLHKKIILSLIFVYYFLSFGPWLSIAGRGITYLPYYYVLMILPPFSITRTPARMGIIVTFLVTLYAAHILDKTLGRQKNMFTTIVLLGLAIYGIFSTTVFENNIHILSTNYDVILPKNGLKQISSDKENVYVLNVPIATVGDDPSQNFLQLFHKKKIISGLISYAAQTNETFSFIANDPLLSRLGCSNDRFPFIQINRTIDSKNIMYNSSLFAKSLEDKNIKYIIVNKELLKNDYCNDMRQYVEDFIERDSRIKLLDKTDSYSIFQI